MQVDKAGKTYWDNFWEKATLISAINPRLPGLNNYIPRKFHEYFSAKIKKEELKGKRILEIGCARSQWLPYFAKEFGSEITGVDYSEIGCEHARMILANEGVSGEVVCANIFDPPGYLLEKFDVVISFGVAEHFNDTTSCVSSFKKFFKVYLPVIGGLCAHI